MKWANCSILDTHGARTSDDGVADAQLGQRLAKRMPTVARASGPGHPPTSHRRQHTGTGLNRGALHVVQHAPHSAHLLAAARAAGTAVDEHRQR